MPTAKKKNEAKQPKSSQTEDIPDEWLEGDFSGQLAVDVYQTPEHIVIESTIAGVRPEDLDISVTNDMVTIKGVRRREQTVADEDYLFRECYWGGFSRRIILPVDVRTDSVNATMKDGILTITLPKVERPKPKSVRVSEADDEDEPEADDE
ncbi:MAG: Hsp20/alpha crystallin family protein [Candidatus Kerfeldbacteria bacterium]|nr:Hsp20/alpha crystallin family protein [Candidatus Kerfeldbacteria bacterium]